MPQIDIPSTKGRRFKSEKINTNESVNFDLPPRDPGKVPSLPRPLSPSKKSNVILGVPPKDLGLKVEQELAIATTGRQPIPPPNPKIVPSKQPKETLPNLSEII
jgi:hypothetical protein